MRVPGRTKPFSEIEKMVPFLKQVGFQVLLSQSHPGLWVVVALPADSAFYATDEQVQYLFLKCEGRYSVCGFGEEPVRQVSRLEPFFYHGATVWARKVFKQTNDSRLTLFGAPIKVVPDLNALPDETPSDSNRYRQSNTEPCPPRKRD